MSDSSDVLQRCEERLQLMEVQLELSLQKMIELRGVFSSCQRDLREYDADTEASDTNIQPFSHVTNLQLIQASSVYK